MKNFVKENWFKLVVAVSILFFVASIGYYFIVLTPKQQKFSNCLKSYDEGFQDFLITELRLSSSDLCRLGLNFSDFIDIGRPINDEIEMEYKQKYENPEDPWIKSKMEKEIYEKMRLEILLKKPR